MRRFKCISAALFFVLVNWQEPARAGTFFFEAGGGVSAIQNNAPFFSASASASSNLAIAANVGIFYGLGNGNSAIDLQFGIEGLLDNATSFNQYYALLIPYPVVRLQVTRLYFGAGYAPLIFDRFDTTPGVSASNATGSSFLGQVGFLLPISPKLSSPSRGITNS